MDPTSVDPSWRRWVVRHLEALLEVGRARIELTVQSWRSVLEASGARTQPEQQRAGTDESAVADRADRIETAIRRIDRFVPASTCIHRAVACRRMLSRRGIDARVVIGLKSDDELAGHAWVEIGEDDRPITLFAGDEGGFRPVDLGTRRRDRSD